MAQSTIHMPSEIESTHAVMKTVRRTRAAYDENHKNHWSRK
jgi:hypothetical protein